MMNLNSILSFKNNLKFKTIVIGVLMLGGLHAVMSQETSAINKVVDSLANKMFVDMNNRDYDAILEMTHPKVFELAPRETIRTVFKSTFEGNEEFTIDIPKTIPKYKLSQVFKGQDQNRQYAFVSYDLRMNMTFHKQEFDQTGKDMMINVMNAQGMEVTFVSDSSMDVLMSNSLTIILKDDSTNNKWVMINYDPDSPLFYQVLPSSLIEKSKTYKQQLMLDSKKETED